jgi:hypothetical protein
MGRLVVVTDNNEPTDTSVRTPSKSCMSSHTLFFLVVFLRDGGDLLGSALGCCDGLLRFLAGGNSALLTTIKSGL